MSVGGSFFTTFQAISCSANHAAKLAILSSDVIRPLYFANALSARSFLAWFGIRAAAQIILLRQRQVSRCEYVFVMDTDPARPASVSAVNHAHERVRDALGLSSEFVLHSLRLMFGTRLGEAGVDAFTIMRIMGHSTITVSQRYVHPTPETMENAFVALEFATHEAERKAAEEAEEKSAGVATDPATVESATHEVIH